MFYSIYLKGLLGPQGNLWRFRVDTEGSLADLYRRVRATRAKVADRNPNGPISRG
jgi:hypothetical protein